MSPVKFVVLVLAVFLGSCSHQSDSAKASAASLPPGPRVLDPKVLTSKHKCVPLASMSHLNVKYAALAPTKNAIQTLVTTWTDEERREDAERQLVAFPRLVAFQTTDRGLWITLFNSDRSKGGPDNMVFQLDPTSSGWKLNAVGAYRATDYGPSQTTWLEILGGQITIDSGSCDPSDTIRCTFELDAKFGTVVKLHGAFAYRASDDIDGIPGFLLRREDR